MSSHDVLEALDGRISYRQLDYWIRRGWIRLDTPVLRGSGFHRLFTPAEVEALSDLIGVYENVSQTFDEIRSGQLWRELVDLHLPLAVAP